uniref:protein-tyrosine-phosphatase n=1 Tax=Panagrellus redivivus TaxID=6233 RepID=A0A7E4UP03_PANRE
MLQAGLIGLQLGVVKKNFGDFGVLLFAIPVQYAYVFLNDRVAATPFDLIAKFRAYSISNTVFFLGTLIQFSMVLQVRVIVTALQCFYEHFSNDNTPIFVVDLCEVDMKEIEVYIIVFEVFVGGCLTLVAYEAGMIRRSVSLKFELLFFAVLLWESVCGCALVHLVITRELYAEIPDEYEAKTLQNRIMGMSKDAFNKKYILIDCRYPYEFEGGHITHAINIYRPADLVTRLFEHDALENNKNKIPILYSEDSKERAVKMVQALRRHDRARSYGSDRYLAYPGTFLLRGGYQISFKLQEA